MAFSDNPTEADMLSAVSTNLQRGRAGRLGELVREMLDNGTEPVKILNEGLIAGMNEVGVRFRDNEIFVPEVLIAARAMICGMNVLRPYIIHANLYPVGRVVLGTVRGDIHDIGKNLVRMMMESKCIDVIDLGTNVSPAHFVQAAKQYNCRIICCSALLTTTMKSIDDVVQAFKQAGMRDQVKIMIGGAPVTEIYCRTIGADVYTPDATSAAEAALRLIEEMKNASS